MSESAPLFNPGQIGATPGALAALEAAGAEPLTYVRRHLSGDWGDLRDEDKAENDFSIGRELRILSAYLLSDDTKIWIITEADRSATTIMLPEEY